MMQYKGMNHESIIQSIGPNNIFSFFKAKKTHKHLTAIFHLDILNSSNLVNPILAMPGFWVHMDPKHIPNVN